MSNIPEIPWADATSWQAANQTLSLLVGRQGTVSSGSARLAGDIQQSLDMISPMMDRLCRHTCPWCPQPCCLSAHVWFDFSDLLFLHWSRSAIPLSQPRIRRGETCRFLGTRGCRLPRLMRPWLCTWYICPTQMAWWRKSAPEEAEHFKNLVRGVRSLRRSLEMAFIEGEMCDVFKK